MRPDRGLMLPMVLGSIVLATILFTATSWATRQARHRLALSKHQEAAIWLAESGLEVGRSRYRSGQLAIGHKLRASFRQGRFEVELQQNAGRLELVSSGYADTQSHTEREEVD